MNQQEQEVNERLETNKKGRLLTAHDVRKSWWIWWFTLETNDSYERLQGLSVCLSLIPILKKLYQKKEDFSAALKRHLQFFNTNGIWGSIVHGITVAMEEQKAMGANIPDETITSVKTGLMGPFAGIGDTIDWATWLPILIGLFIPLAKEGSWVAGIVPFILFLAITIFEGMTLDRIGYNAGMHSATQILQSGKIQQVIIFASVLGLIMMGGLAASTVTVSTPLVIKTATTNIKVQQDILDKILLGILPLAVVSGVYALIDKMKLSYTITMFILLGAGLVLGSLGIL